MKWDLLTQADACFFMWYGGAAQDFGINTYTQLAQEIEHDSVYGLVYQDELIALARVSWIIQPWSCYFSIWVKPNYRGAIKKKVEIFTSLREHFTDLKIHRILALCRSKAVASLCQKMGATIEAELKDLYWKDETTYVCFWSWD